MRNWPRSRHPAAAPHTPGNRTAALTPAQTAAAPTATLAQTRPATRTATAAPSSTRRPLPPPDDRRRRHTNHTLRHTRTLTAAHARSHLEPHSVPSRGVCVCDTPASPCLPPFRRYPSSYPIQAAPPEPPNLATQPQLITAPLIHTTRVIHSPSEEVLARTPCLSFGPHLLKRESCSEPLETLATENRSSLGSPSAAAYPQHAGAPKPQAGRRG